MNYTSTAGLNLYPYTCDGFKQESFVGFRKRHAPVCWQRTRPIQIVLGIRYQQYEAIEGCIPGPADNGRYNCGGGTGHRGIIGYEWRNHSSGGEIPPSAVQNLPVALMADINNDSTPDAYWDNNLPLRRMDGARSVNHP